MHHRLKIILTANRAFRKDFWKDNIAEGLQIFQGKDQACAFNYSINEDFLLSHYFLRFRIHAELPKSNGTDLVLVPNEPDIKR